MKPSSRPVRWGVLGAARIAQRFVTAARTVEGCEVVAVAGRTPGKAAEFARQWELPNAYESYDELLADPAVDAVYVAVTHNFHAEVASAALRAGKPVLCEKPLCVNASQARSLLQLAEERGLFLMEAMWTRFLPAMRQAMEWVRKGKIGDVRQIRADFCFQVDYDPEHRLFNPALAGGALLDVGIYPLAFSSMVMDGAAPREASSLSLPAPTGVDAQTGLLLAYEGSVLALLTCATQARAEQRAEILGTAGRIVFPGYFPGATKVELHRYKEKSVLTRDFPHGPGGGFEYQITEACTCIREGRLHSSLMPPSESLQLAETMDRIRAQIGLRYPFESAPAS
jgi:dihydrodiol dehydrogenase / D-xylose 1-dehydrogenase (NADP)